MAGTVNLSIIWEREDFEQILKIISLIFGLWYFIFLRYFGHIDRHKKIKDHINKKETLLSHSHD